MGKKPFFKVKAILSPVALILSALKTVGMKGKVYFNFCILQGLKEAKNNKELMRQPLEEAHQQP